MSERSCCKLKKNPARYDRYIYKDIMQFLNAYYCNALLQKLNDPSFVHVSLFFLSADSGFSQGDALPAGLSEIL